MKDSHAAELVPVSDSLPARCMYAHVLSKQAC